MLKTAVMAAMGLLALGHVVYAQANKECGGGAELRLSARQARQGDLLRVEAEGSQGMQELKGEWGGHDVAFWKDAAGGSEQWRALLGVDLEQTAGKSELQISGKLADGTALNCTATIVVQEGNFATEKLQVEKQFVEPDPAQLRRAKEETARLQAIFATVTPEKLWSGKFLMPLDGIYNGRNFGRRRVLNGQPRSPHSGVDFPAASGTPVHASQSGRVVLAENLFFAGNTVIVDHGLGIYTLYGHLSAIDVKPGENVQAGAVLGKVGATGRVTGPHLHWGLTVERARVNALEIVKLPQ
jgi:murein DD-endopeptidase MepM/ murein hydrolase activator NlpD